MSVVYPLSRGTLPLAPLGLLFLLRFVSASRALEMVGVAVLVIGVGIAKTREIRQL